MFLNLKVIGDYVEKWQMKTRHGESSDMVARSMALIGSVGATKKRRFFSLLGEKERYITDSFVKFGLIKIHLEIRNNLCCEMACYESSKPVIALKASYYSFIGYRLNATES